jgi:hypothetical protein
VFHRSSAVVQLIASPHFSGSFSRGAHLSSEDWGDKGFVGGESRSRRNLRSGSVASRTEQPPLRIEAVCRRFRDLSMAQEAKEVEKGRDVAAHQRQSIKNAMWEGAAPVNGC